jgi:FkbM family methyltransferase
MVCLRKRPTVTIAVNIRAGLDRVRDVLPGGHGRVSFSQEGEDLILDRIFENQSAGIYVDVGAHHPQRFSNTHLLYRRGWHGVNIDATPGSMRSFRRIRPRDVNLEIGVTAKEEVRDFFVFNEPALNTFDAARAKSLDRPPYVIEHVHKVRCAPLSAILSEHSIGPIDLLTIDAEGFDFEVLQTLDWKVSRPHVVLTEQFSRDIATLLASEMHAFMHDRGYQLIAKTFNSVFYIDHAARLRPSRTAAQ